MRMAGKIHEALLQDGRWRAPRMALDKRHAYHPERALPHRLWLLVG